MVTFEGDPVYDENVGGIHDFGSVTFRARHNGQWIMCDVSLELIEDEFLPRSNDRADLVAACVKHFDRLKIAATALIEAGRIERRQANGQAECVVIRELP